MSGLAKILLKNKAIVSGSDMTESSVVDKLNEMGGKLKIGHRADNLDPHTDAVVISAAVKETNPELMAARASGCTIYKYAQMLGELANQYDLIAVSGTHGKSTTSGWLAYCLQKAGLGPNYIIGADIIQLGSSSGTGDSNYFVAEACEYDRSFLNLKPMVGCILNIEADHLDYYKDEAEIVEAFHEFAAGIRSGGVLVANGQDANVAMVLAQIRGSRRCETFGLSEDCDFYARDIRWDGEISSFEVFRQGELLGRARTSLPGFHNVNNALAVIAMAGETGLKPKDIFECMSGFVGMDRRVMLKERIEGITILDDYAHHPTEIQASLKAIRLKYNPKRLWCIFQPHQYSRTRFLLDDFAESFKLADVTIVPEIYFVRDSDAEKMAVNAEVLANKINANGSRAVFINSFELICRYLQENVSDGDLVVTMGAGDVWKIADEYIRRLRTNR